MRNETENDSGSRVLPPAEDVLAAAIQYLVEGEEHQEASVLGQCTLELAAPPVCRGAKQRVNVTLRGSRKVVERLRPPADGEDESALRRRIRLAIQNALPCGFKMAVFGARVGLANRTLRVVGNALAGVTVDVGPPGGANGRESRLLTAGNEGGTAWGCEAGIAVLGTKLDEGFSRVSHEVRRVAVGVEQMGGHVEAVARSQRELRQENEELKAARERLMQMQGENLFKFVQKIDDRAFRVVCAVLVHGDVAKAARALDMNDSTLREFIGTWKKRGGAYLGLLEIMQWRKRRRVTGTIPFNDALLYNTGGDGNRELVLQEVLDGVLSMTEGNWQDICIELEMQLREQLGK